MYSVDKNRGASKFSNTIGLSTKDSNPARDGSAPNYFFYEIEAAEIIDIILNVDHPNYTNTSDIGKAKIRMINSENGKAEDVLSFAKPLQSNIKNYPLKHEIVLVANYLGELYYFNRINIFNNVNENSLPNVSLPNASNIYSKLPQISEYTEIFQSGNPNITTNNNIKLGDKFKSKKINFILPNEGDIIFEGRYGHYLKFGSINQNPNIILTAGNETENSEITFENINTDLNSIWMISDSQIEFSPSTVNSNIHLKSYENKPNEFNGNQIFISSDRIILNSKLNEIMGFAKKSINFVTNDTLTIDANKNIILNTNENTIIESKKIFLGKKDATEPLVLGEKLKKFLEELIDEILKLTVPTGVGPSGTVINFSQFQLIKNKLNSILSNQNYTI